MACFPVISPPLLMADVSWISKATDCAGFERGLKSFYSELGRADEVSDSQRSELKLVRSEACGGRFAQCGFDICSAPKPATEKLIPKPFAARSTVEPITREVAPPEPAASKDPLAWLKQEMDCGVLQEQIKVRYGPLGPYSQMNPDKRAELDRIFVVACSERFAYCNFNNCPGSHPKSGPQRPAAGSALDITQRSSTEVQVEREEYYEELVAEKTAERQALIAAKMKEERSTGATWISFRVPSEVTSRESEEEEERPTIRKPVSPRGSKPLGTTPSGKPIRKPPPRPR